MIRSRLLRPRASLTSLALALALAAPAGAAQPQPVKPGDTLSGELLAMRSRAKGKRIVTFQLTGGPYRIPGPDGLCNLETGPETFQLVTRSDAEVSALKGLVGKTISVKADEIACAQAAGQVTDAVITKWTLVR